MAELVYCLPEYIFAEEAQKNYRSGMEKDGLLSINK
jgi:hypothetical protein